MDWDVIGILDFEYKEISQEAVAGKMGISQTVIPKWSVPQAEKVNS